jgi:hypothetical protein
VAQPAVGIGKPIAPACKPAARPRPNKGKWVVPSYAQQRQENRTVTMTIAEANSV